MSEKSQKKAMFQRIELLFWDITISLMEHSPFVQQLLKRGYPLLKKHAWVIPHPDEIAFALAALLMGLIIGLLQAG